MSLIIFPNFVMNYFISSHTLYYSKLISASKSNENSVLVACTHPFDGGVWCVFGTYIH